MVGERRGRCGGVVGLIACLKVMSRRKELKERERVRGVKVKVSDESRR